MLVDGLQNFLAANTDVQSALGTATSRNDKTTGIFPTQAPDSVAVPYLVMQQVSGDGGNDETFAGTGPLHNARWRFSCYGTTARKAKVLAKIVKRTLVSCLGTLGTSLCTVEAAWFRMETDDAEPIPHGTIYSTHVDFSFMYVDLDNTNT